MLIINDQIYVTLTERYVCRVLISPLNTAKHLRLEYFEVQLEEDLSQMDWEDIGSDV